VIAGLELYGATISHGRYQRNALGAVPLPTALTATDAAFADRHDFLSITVGYRVNVVEKLSRLYRCAGKSHA
jgi:hypothetical protein